MLVSDFDYNLPPELIAQKPLPLRDESRMMVVLRSEKKFFHSQFKQLPQYLNKGDVLVLNNARVIPAKIWGKKDGKEIEFLLLKEIKKCTWEVLCRPAKKIKVGDVIFFTPEVKAEVIETEKEGKRVIYFFPKDIREKIKKIGFAPLPPYIKRQKKNTRLRTYDLERYQTVFAKKEGAIAAPTAGLHFTFPILEQIRRKGVEVYEVCLRVGQATFQPVRVTKLEAHQMPEETYSISPSTAAKITEAAKERRPVLAVGTTVVRALESAFQDGRVRPGTDSTSLFIYPGYEFRVVDRLLTNFHLPKSTLLMMVSAFSGFDLITEAYKEAIRHKYRFYSYGDCMLIL